MEAKKTNLCIAADVPTAAGVLALAESTGPHICCFKTHCDAVDDWTPATATALAVLAEKHNFLIFEDRKFADIGNTVVSQYQGGVYHIAGARVRGPGRYTFPIIADCQGSDGNCSSRVPPLNASACLRLQCSPLQDLYPNSDPIPPALVAQIGATSPTLTSCRARESSMD